MPELPEVETIVRNLRSDLESSPSLVGRRILSVRTSWPRHIVEPDLDEFQARLRDRRITGIERRGKYIVIRLEDLTLLIHLRMSGDLSMVPYGHQAGRYDHTVFHLSDGWELRFSDARKFGRIHLTTDPSSVLADLGPEPLSKSFRSTDLATLLRSRRRQLKPLLLDQTVLAGVGNIYADEALHRAGLHPLRRSDRLTDEEVHRLWKSLRSALRHGIKTSGASIDWVYQGGSFQDQLRVYGREGEPCTTCGGEITRIIVGQRGTHLCLSCQPEVDNGD